MRGDNHACQQIDGTVFQTLDALGTRTGKVLDIPMRLAGDMGEDIGNQTLYLFLRIGEYQRWMLMNTDDDPLVGGRCDRRR